MSNTQHDSEVPADGQQVITAVALIAKFVDGEPHIFVAKRAGSKKFLPGVYELPGGHIDFGERLHVGLKREIKEEFGVDIAVGDPVGAFTYLNEVKGSHSIEVAYLAELISPESAITLDPEDHSQSRWITEAQFNAEAGKPNLNLTPNEQYNVATAFRLLKNQPIKTTLDQPTIDKYEL